METLVEFNPESCPLAVTKSPDSRSEKIDGLVWVRNRS